MGEVDNRADERSESGLCSLMCFSFHKCCNSDYIEDLEARLTPLGMFMDEKERRKDAGADETATLSPCTRVFFIIGSVLLIILFVLQSLAILSRLIVGEFHCKKLSLDGLQANSNSSVDVNFNRLFDMLLFFVGILHIPEYWYLLCYLYKFLGVYKGWNKYYKQAIRFKMRSFMCAKKRFIYYIFTLVLFMLVAMAIPPTCIIKVYINQGISKKVQCSEELELVVLSLTHTFHATSFIINGVVVLARCLMIFFTMMVGVMWRRVRPPPVLADGAGQPPPVPDDGAGQPPPVPDDGVGQPPSAPDDQAGQPPSASDDGAGQSPSVPDDGAGQPPPENQVGQEPGIPLVLHVQFQDDAKKVLDRHSRLIMEFRAIKENVVHIYKIFRSFFVLQWIVHLVGLFAHIAHLLRPWVRHGQIDDFNSLIATHQVYQFLYVLFDGLALIIAHICALKMNAYFRRYVRQLQNKQVKEAQGNLQISLSHLILIKSESVSKATFSPRIPGLGLSIAINSPTFVLSIILTIFALIGTLVAF